MKEYGIGETYSTNVRDGKYVYNFNQKSRREDATLKTQAYMGGIISK
jgi:hypothetical protein